MSLPANLSPDRLTGALALAEKLAQSQFVPAQFRSKPGDVLAAILYGLELGLGPMQALRSIAVVNGRPAIWGDGLLAVCQRHPAWRGIQERIEGDGDARRAVCTVMRAPDQTVTRTFSVADARRARLWGREGPWTQYPDRMLQMRARSWALRDAFADALCGLVAVEEALDAPLEIASPSAGPSHVVQSAADALRAALATAPDADSGDQVAPVDQPTADHAGRQRQLVVRGVDGSPVATVTSARQWAAAVERKCSELESASAEEKFAFARHNIATARQLSDKFPASQELSHVASVLEQWLPPEDDDEDDGGDQGVLL